MDKSATTYDYQARGREFAVNDYVHPIGAGPMDIGRVSQSWPGIGMVMVEFPYGSRQYPVEDVEKINPANSPVIPTSTDNVPGGVERNAPVSAGRPTVPTVQGGQETESGKDSTIQTDATTGPEGGASPASKTASFNLDKMVNRVLEAHIKKGLYWHSADRNYRVNKAEFESGNYACPKCKAGPMKKAIYKMRGGARHRLFICPACTFVIKTDNIHTDHVHTDHVASEKGPEED